MTTKELTSTTGVGTSGELTLDFPILTKPEQAMRLLVGADVDLFTLILPTFSIFFEVEQKKTVMAGPIPVSFGIGFGVNVDLTLAVGMDTAGYRDFARTGDEGDIGNGFFFYDVREGLQNTTGDFPSTKRGSRWTIPPNFRSALRSP